MRQVKPTGDFLVPVISSGHEAHAKVSDFAKGAGLAQMVTDVGGSVTVAINSQGGVSLLANADVPAAINLDFLNVRAKTAARQISLPTPYGPGTPANQTAEVTHPSVVFEKNGWNGYRYWMAYTPYPSSNSAYENPCICASNNGVDFELPAGAANPLFPTPSTGYNSDTHLYLSGDKSKLYLIWRARNINISGTNYNVLYVTESTDGSNWKSPVNIWQGVVGVSDAGSPSLWHDGTNWNIVSHNLDVGGFTLRKMQSPTLYSGWPATPTDITLPHPSAGTWWHSFWVKQPSDSKLIGLLQDGSSSGGRLFWAKTTDFVTFALAPVDFGTTGFYRSTFCTETADDGSTTLRVFPARISGGFYVRSVLATFDKLDTSRRRSAEFMSAVNGQASGLAEFIYVDTIARADSTSGLGTATSGQNYTQDTGPTNVIGISGKRAYNVNTSNCRALLSVGVADFVYSLRFVSVGAGAQAWAIFRAANTTNYWRVGVLNGRWTVQKITSGAVGDVNITTDVFPADGDYLRIDCRGNRISISVNEIEVFNRIDSYNATSVQIGLQMSGATSYVDRLMCTSV